VATTYRVYATLIALSIALWGHVLALRASLSRYPQHGVLVVPSADHLDIECIDDELWLLGSLPPTPPPGVRSNAVFLAQLNERPYFDPNSFVHRQMSPALLAAVAEQQHGA